MFLNAMFAHGYMPDKLMQSVIIPIDKNMKDDITNMDNYRPIASVTVTHGVSSAGLDGGGAYRSVFRLARAPLVAEGRVTGCVPMAGTPDIYSRAARPHVQSYIVQACRERMHI